MLVAVLDKKYRKPVKCEEGDLELYFNKNRKKYKWELPHFRGAVIHCRNEREAKRIKKFLKKYSFLEWEKRFMEIVKQHPESFRIECGIFQIGTNPYVDRLAFKCGSYEPIENLPYTFVMGKKIKKGPENYTDVMDELVGDYLAEHENDWLYELKTVNFGGSY